MIEQNSPQIVGYDEECWLAFMKRDIPRYETRPHRVTDPTKWYKAYKKLKKEADAEMAAGTDRLRAALTSIKEEKEQNLARLTTNAAMPGKRTNTGWSGRANWGPSTKHMSASERIKRNQADAQRARMIRERNQIKMGRALKACATPQNFAKVTVAPRSMIEEVKKANAPPPPEPKVIRAPVRRGYIPRPPMPAPKDEERKRPREAGAGYDLIGDREARLKAMQTKKHEPTPHSNQQSPSKVDDGGGLSLDFLEDDELFSDDGNASSPAKTATPQKASSEGLVPPRQAIVSHPPRPVSPRPLPAKRKAPPSIFMAKRPRTGVS